MFNKSSSSSPLSTAESGEERSESTFGTSNSGVASSETLVEGAGESTEAADKSASGSSTSAEEAGEIIPGKRDSATMVAFLGEVFGVPVSNDMHPSQLQVTFKEGCGGEEYFVRW